MAWLKKWWWAILLGCAIVLSGLMWLIFRRRKVFGNSISFSAKARAEIATAEVDAIVAKEKAKTKSSHAMYKLREIEGMSDSVKRRVALASYLDGML